MISTLSPMPTNRSAVPPNMKVALRLAALLDFHGMTKSELARQLGVTPSSVTQWIKGLTALSAPNALKIADLFGEDVEFVMGRVDKGSRGLGATTWATDTMLGGELMKKLGQLSDEERADIRALVAAHLEAKPAPPNGKPRARKKV